jgi:hypothetical protein
MLAVMDKTKPADERLKARSDLLLAIGRAMPHVSIDDAREALMSWWRVDHPDEPQRGKVPQESESAVRDEN